MCNIRQAAHEHNPNVTPGIVSYAAPTETVSIHAAVATDTGTV